MFSLFQKNYKSMTPKMAKELLSTDEKVHLIDVRTPEEFRSIRIPKSMNVPLNNLVAGIKKVAPDKDDTIVVYCQSGARASSAANQLSEMGYTNVYNLGGIMSWPYETVSSR